MEKPSLSSLAHIRVQYIPWSSSETSGSAGWSTTVVAGSLSEPIESSTGWGGGSVMEIHFISRQVQRAIKIY